MAIKETVVMDMDVVEKKKKNYRGEGKHIHNLYKKKKCSLPLKVEP
jgi:hypothetical protein